MRPRLARLRSFAALLSLLAAHPSSALKYDEFVSQTGCGVVKEARPKLYEAYVAARIGQVYNGPTKENGMRVYLERIPTDAVDLSKRFSELRSHIKKTGYAPTPEITHGADWDLVEHYLSPAANLSAVQFKCAPRSSGSENESADVWLESIRFPMVTVPKRGSMKGWIIVRNYFDCASRCRWKDTTVSVTIDNYASNVTNNLFVSDALWREMKYAPRRWGRP